MAVERKRQGRENGVGDDREPMDTSNQTSMFAEKYNREQLPDLLRIYYQRIFPFQKYFEWLFYDRDSFRNREFSFTLEDDIYVRYQSFESREDLEEGVRKARPYKIDIGAIFSHRPKDHKKIIPANFKAEQKELVFDIDMTDYDDIRTCCKEANICPKCWRFMTIAMQILDRTLREDFGFQHLLWVYSGRRGVHCWVCDKHVRELSQEARIAVCEYLTLVKGGEQQAKKVQLKTLHHQTQSLHPSVTAALHVVDHHFQQLVVEQELLKTPDVWEKILQLLPKQLASELDSEWKENENDSLHRWKRLEDELIKSRKEKLLSEIKLQFSYPRLDVNVTRGVNHLLKSPLCIHPKTGRVCVPIDIKRLEEFDPFVVPTINQICREFEASTDDERKGYERTSLRPYMTIFSGFVKKLRATSGRVRLHPRNKQD